MLVRFGLREGAPNTHPGQGTACRHFSFANAMLELLWVADPAEAQNQATRRTHLWERWSGRASGASPFGIAVRPARPQSIELPFPAWTYKPVYLPDSLAIDIGEADVEEPMWFYLAFMRRAEREQRFVEHPIGVREITGVWLTSPSPVRSIAGAAVIARGIISTRNGSTPLLELEFDGRARNENADFRPYLPLVFHF